MVKSACQSKFQIREVEAYTTPSPPVLVSGRLGFLQLRHRRLLSPGGEGFHSLTLPALVFFYSIFRGLGFVPVSGLGVVSGSWFR